MAPAVLAAIYAIGALGQAAGQAYAGKVQGDAMDENAAIARKKLLMEQQNRQEDRQTDAERYADLQAEKRRQMAASAPANSISLLSGLSGLREGLNRSSNADYLGMLAKR